MIREGDNSNDINTHAEARNLLNENSQVIYLVTVFQATFIQIYWKKGLITGQN